MIVLISFKIFNVKILQRSILVFMWNLKSLSFNCRLTKQIEAMTNVNAAEVDEELDKDVRKMVIEFQDHVNFNSAEGSFQRFF
jgi:hypothetical protein